MNIGYRDSCWLKIHVRKHSAGLCWVDFSVRIEFSIWKMLHISRRLTKNIKINLNYIVIAVEVGVIKWFTIIFWMNWKNFIINKKNKKDFWVTYTLFLNNWRYNIGYNINFWTVNNHRLHRIQNFLSFFFFYRL